MRLLSYGRDAVLVELTVRQPKAKRAEDAANALAQVIKATTTSFYVKQSIAANWTGANPGIPTTDVQTQRAASNNGGLGAASFAALPTVQTPMPNGGTIPNGPFVWQRQDQVFQLVIPRAQAPSQTANSSAVVTYTFSRS